MEMWVATGGAASAKRRCWIKIAIYRDSSLGFSLICSPDSSDPRQHPGVLLSLIQSLIGGEDFSLLPLENFTPQACVQRYPGIAYFPARNSGAGRNPASSTHQPGGVTWATVVTNLPSAASCRCPFFVTIPGCDALKIRLFARLLKGSHS